MSVVPMPVAEAIAERRLAVRVPVHWPLHVWDGLRRIDAHFIDLSLTGCRMLCREPVSTNRKLWVLLPGGFGGRWPRPVRGAVTRSESVVGEPTGVCEVSVQFTGSNGRPRITEALTGLLSGDIDRRQNERVVYERRVIARGPDRPRVLIGQDLSAGGMRVSSGDGLTVGDRIQVALHAGGTLPPLVVDAEVARHDADGVGLSFVDLDEASALHLERLLAAAPVLSDERGEPAIVTTLEPRSAE